MEARDSSLLHHYRKYVPALIIDRLLIEGRPAEPSSERMQCAVLFADISGFTPLTEAFAAEGPDGAESLTHVLNDFFGRLIDTVQSHGGDIVKFAGDAMTVLWRANADRSDLPATTLRAASCALQMQRAVRGYTAGEHNLLLKVAVGAGTLAVVHVGGEFNRWEFAIVGQPMHQVGSAGDAAEPGDVLVSPDAWPLIAPEATAPRQREGGNRILEAVDSVLVPTHSAAAPLPGRLEEAVRGYLPAAITRRIMAGQTDYLSELRSLTILFINLADIRYDTPLEVAQAAMRGLQRALYFPFEGSINKLSVDDKGVTLIAALGLPPFAHEDDPARGVLAALAMHRVLDDLQLRCDIGVTTGRVYCGSVGSPIRQEYTIMGDKVNLAARLMQNAKGGILVDADTHERSTDQVDYDAGHDLTVKGKALPVRAYVPREGRRREERQARTLGESGLIGRRAELEQMAAALDELLALAQNRAVVIEGEAGVGKSRLLEAMLPRITAAPVRLLHGGADAIEQTTSYLAWQDLLLQLLQLDNVPPAERGERVATVLANDPGALALLPLLNGILSLDVPESALTREMSGEVRANNLHQLIVQLLGFSAARQPLVLVIDDVHWLDSASWALLHTVVNSISPVLVVLLTRPLGAAAPTELKSLLGGSCRHIVLERMAPEETVELVARRLGVAALPAAAAALIRDRAEGHPFFAEEIGYALRDAGLLLIEGNVCRIRDANALAHADLPATIEGIITSRIDRLAPAQQLTVKVASVIGRVFSLSLLRDIFPVHADRDALPAHLTALQQLDLTPLESAVPEPQYFFKHVITQQVAYDLMLREQRSTLHRAVATWHEQHHGHELTLFYPLLAHHWNEAHEPAKTIDYLELAAEQAVTANANTEALRFLDDIDGQHEQLGTDANARLRRAHRLQLRGRAYHSLGRLEDAKRASLDALTALGEPFPETTANIVGQIAAQLARQIWYRKVGPGMPPRDPEERRRLKSASNIAEDLFLIYFFDNDVLRILISTLWAINLSERAGEISQGLIRGYLSLAIALEAVPRRHLADAYIARALRVLDQQENRAIRAWSYVALAVLAGGRGDWEGAEKRSAAALTINKQLGDQRSWEEAAGNLQLIRTIYGRFDDPEGALYTQLMESGLRRDSTQVQGWGHALRSTVFHHQQRDTDVGVSLDAFNAFLAAKTDFRDEITRLEGFGLSAQRYLRENDLVQARAHLDRAYELIAKLGMPSQYRNLPSAQFVAEAAIEWWKRHPRDAVARRHLRRAIGFVQRCANTFPVAAAKIRWLRGKIAWYEGDRVKARKLWTQSAEHARNLKLPYDELLVLTVLAHIDNDAGARHRAALLQAQMRIGVPYEARGVLE